jgi:hypothetical protein
MKLAVAFAEYFYAEKTKERALAKSEKPDLIFFA